MLGQEDNPKDIKDSKNNFGIMIKDIPISISYTKTNKLITALYMVTDIISEDEPLRLKLRTLGTGIVSDIHQLPARAAGKISEVMSFLDIAKTLQIISAMNCEILRKEFIELNQSIAESADKAENFDNQVDLSEFFKPELGAPGRYLSKGTSGGRSSHGHYSGIGVQKGSTLMKALSDRTKGLSDRKTSKTGSENFDILKKERRYEIVSFIKVNGGSATITDIRTRAKGALASCGEKTLQRELVSMTKDGVLKKTGEKRWSRYFLENKLAN